MEQQTDFLNMSGKSHLQNGMGYLVLWVNFFFSRLNLVQMHIFLPKDAKTTICLRGWRGPLCLSSVDIWQVYLSTWDSNSLFITSGSLLLFEFLSNKPIGESAWEPMSFSALVIWSKSTWAFPLETPAKSEMKLNSVSSQISSPLERWVLEEPKASCQLLTLVSF